MAGILDYKKEEGCCMETDEEMAAILRQEFPALNESNRKKAIEMAKFLVLLPRMLLFPVFWKQKGFLICRRKKKDLNKGYFGQWGCRFG
jgi:hypothetical protein